MDKYEETLAAEPDLNLAAWGLAPEDEHLLRLLLDGLSQKEAGLRLGLSQQAVSRRLKRLAKSL